MSLQLALLLIGSYFLGAIPFGVFIARSRGVDITKIGSGNIGATNVHRALGGESECSRYAAGHLEGLPTRPGRPLAWVFRDLALVAGFAAVLGHCASPFLAFKGGKGVATILGAAIGATPYVALAGILGFAAAYGMSQIVSISSIVAVLCATLAAFLLRPTLRYDWLVVAAYWLISLFIIFKHRLNIQRLFRGEEPKTPLKGGEKG